MSAPIARTQTPLHLRSTNAERVGFQNAAAGIAMLKVEHSFGWFFFFPLCTVLLAEIHLFTLDISDFMSIRHFTPCRTPQPIIGKPAGMQSYSVLLASVIAQCLHGFSRRRCTIQACVSRLKGTSSWASKSRWQIVMLPCCVMTKAAP